MGVSTRENGVLKVVHPGRHVETHRQPIIAAEIMKKYPRHCIARPDVFQFPWIVVRPESVLYPGKVFYLIPHRTLYKLLKNARKKMIIQQPEFQENQFSRNDCYQKNYRSSAIKCWGGGIMPTKHRHQTRQRIKNRTNNIHDVQDSEGYESDTSYVDAWVQLTDKLRKLKLDSSFDNDESFHQKRTQNSATNSTLAMIRHGRLRSCFRKNDSGRRLLNLRVTFGPPIIIPVSPPESLNLEQAM
ncbi:hypothetical protein M9H77_01202 [Catharanthus roseus]|uniref:Uncharacterized protein n=1 Tax=Catharanthus roseus TaxID=4058 RepID=A0ACC0C515_CATRO|nr:hypothetical protein M9H77_01202 [Catharanthus roseus]